MGCGKNSVGWRIAALVGAEFVDMDQYIEEKAGKSISRIFADSGEESFRRMETEASAELVARDNVVIATGGGTVMNPENVRCFHDGGGVICFLDVPVAALQERLKGDKRRPLLQRPDRREFIAKLHAERYPKYCAAADHIIEAGAPPAVVARRIRDTVNKL